MVPLKITLIGGGKISCGKNRFSGIEPMSHMEGIIMSQSCGCTCGGGTK